MCARYSMLIEKTELSICNMHHNYLYFQQNIWREECCCIGHSACLGASITRYYTGLRDW